MTTTLQAPTVTTLPASSIRPGDNDRQVFDPAELRQLAVSIAELGCLQPPVVRQLADGTFQLIAGERRFRAMTEVLGRDTVDVIVRDVDDRSASQAMLAENTNRKDLDPVAEAEAYRKRMDDFGLTVDEVASWAGKTRSWVANRLKLLTLRPEARYLVQTGQMGIGYTGDLAVLDFDRQMLAIKAWVASDCQMNWYQWHDLTAQLLAEQQAQPLFDPDSFWTLEERLDTSAKAARRAGMATLRKAIGMVVATYDSGRDLAPVIAAIRELADPPEAK